MTTDSDIQTANPVWTDHLRLKSDRFDDVYFSVDNGLDETRYVFLDHNGIPDRWHDKQHFTIIETGFGTGLNFLATWQMWKASAPDGATLSYWSIEKYPVPKAHIPDFFSPWPELADLAGQLHQAYPDPLMPGIQDIDLASDDVSLHLVVGDVTLIETLPVLADAWFLDGFSPKVNPDMWADDIMTMVGEKTAENGTFATFTAAGHVRRALLAAGFDVQKTKGFGRKRDMLCGKKK